MEVLVSHSPVVVAAVLAPVFLLAFAAAPARAERLTLSLNGTWQIADSVAAEPAPLAFRATVAVPGLVHNATPAFPDVDAFDSLELVANQIAQKIRPESARVPSPGVSRQQRNYFWYRRAFTAPARRSVATLRVNKAQFGTAVWLNGKKVGEYPGCFSAGVFDVTRTLKWEGENVLARPRRRAPRRPARDVPGGNGLREAEVDARHLRRRLAARRGQPGDRERPGGPAPRRRRRSWSRRSSRTGARRR